MQTAVKDLAQLIVGAKAVGPNPICSAAVKAPVFELSSLSTVVQHALSSDPGVHVIVAPPGGGKSTLTRRLIVQQIAAGTLKRVLWATRDTREPTSLGQEACDDFMALDSGLDVKIVYGQEHLTRLGRRAEYRQQFTWPHQPGVRIISHAHLHRVLGTEGLQTGLAAADLLVIDEDPTGTLLVNSGPKGLPQFTGGVMCAQSDPTAQALGQMMLDAQSGSWKEYEPFQPDLRRRACEYGLYGKRFWETLTDRLDSAHDPVGFERALLQIAHSAPDVARLLAQAFEADLASFRSGQASQRLGIHGDLLAGFDLRYNLRRSIVLPCPALVLDAYAHPLQYQALFAEHPVKVHSFDLGAPLEVEHALALKLDAYDEGKTRRSSARLQIAEELVQLKQQNPRRGQLLITPKGLTHPSSQWKTLLESTYQQAGFTLTVDAQTGYWFAGRGQNQHAGSDVIALKAPYLPRTHREYQLAALFPSDAAARTELHQHLEATEYLQLLHRGRQHRTYLTGTPRVIVADAQRLNSPSLARWVQVRPYQTSLHFVRGSQSPRWRDATQAIAQDLLDVLGGVPRHALIGAGLVQAHHSSTNTPHLIQGLKRLAAPLPPSAALHQAVLKREQWAYRDLETAKDTHAKAEREVMKRLGLQEFKMPGRGQPIVYATDLPAAQRAYVQFKAQVAGSAVSPTKGETDPQTVGGALASTAEYTQ